MQDARGTVDGEFKISDAASAKEDLHAPSLVDGAIAQEPEVAFEHAGIFAKNFFQVGRAGFFFALKEDLEVDAQGNVGGFQRVNGGEQSLDRRLVVAGGAGVDAPLRV